MLLRYLCTAVVFYFSHHVLAVEYGSDSRDGKSPLFELNLPCAKGSFSGGECLENIQTNTYITIQLSTRNDALLANGDVIFPTPVPMEFNAVRHVGLNTETVRFTYSLDVLHRPDSLGNLHNLKLRLFDAQGCPATENSIVLGLARSNEGNLELSEIFQDPMQCHEPYHQKPFIDETITEDSNDGISVQCMKRPCYGGHRHHHDHHGINDWKDRHYMRHARPVLLPALLGIVASLIAFAGFFIVGNMMTFLYFYVRGERWEAVSPQHDEAVEAEVLIEKPKGDGDF